MRAEERTVRKIMTRFFGQIPWAILLPVALLLGLAPFRPEPHLLEKVKMLYVGQLTRPVDIFDLVMHGTPLLFVLGKLLSGAKAQSFNESTDADRK